LALDPTLRHKRLVPLGGEQGTNHAGDENFVRSNLDTPSSDSQTVPGRMPTIDPKDLIGRSFLQDTEADVQRFCAKIVRAIIEKDSELKPDSYRIRFLCKLDGDTVDEIYTYNQILDLFERDNLDSDYDTEQLYRFLQISAHQGPLQTSDRDYKGSTYNVLVEWESGETTYEDVELNTKD
jgi:hypothetical protein